MADIARFNWLSARGAGILLHPTSLPSPYGIGNLGASARAFIDYLEDAGLKYWQILPLGPTGYGDSPYSAYSVFAGNPLLIDLTELVHAGLLSWEELDPLTHFGTEAVDFCGLKRIHEPLLRLAAKRFRERNLKKIGVYGTIEDFLNEAADWLRPFALFMALKKQHDGRPWYEWSLPWRHFTKAQKTELSGELRQAVDAQIFGQYLFWNQWQAMRRYATDHAVEIIGDLPIYAAADSADVWSETKVFSLDQDGRPLAMAGVPPDYFSATGQLWGNPLYNWEFLAETGFDWWIRRLRQNFALCDVVRLDHFRAFYDYWAVPTGAEDARTGEWLDGPRHAFFKVLRKKLGNVKIIAEDLGEISDGVRDFLHELGLPGMSILHFAFDGKNTNLFLPHNHVHNGVVYPGTHDNDTTLGWYQTLDPDYQDQLRRYFRVSGSDINWDLIRAAIASVSRICIIASQDVLGLGSDARMNRPGVAAGNWSWRMTPQQFDQHRSSAAYFRELTWLHGR